MRKLIAVAVVGTVIFGAFLPITPASAYISGTSGAITKISPPPSVKNQQLTSASTMFAFEERQGVQLASAVPVDIKSVGSYESDASLTPGTIPAGTVVDSHFVNSDRPTSAGSALTGTLTFPTDILGVIITHQNLDNTDGILGSPSTAYPVANLDRDLELDTTKDGVFVTDLRTVTIRSRTANILDQVRIITKHDVPPTANAGGPYAGSEGSAIALHGSASDADNDPLTVSWAFSVNAKPGTVCTPTGASTLTPSITCTDDAVVTATLSVADAFHPAVTSVAQIVVGNSPPSLGALSAPTGQVPLASAVNVNASFSDAGTNDTHTATVTWGDTSSSSATVTDASGSGSLAASHTYSVGGLYTVAVTLKDDDGGTSVQSVQVHINTPPTADAAGPYAGTEGAPAPLAGSASDLDNDSLTTLWSFTPTVSDPGTVCTSSGANTLTPLITCNDDAIVAAQLSADDSINPPVLASTNVAIANAPPVLGVVSSPPGAIPVGVPAALSAAFTDVGTNDSHTASVNWGDLVSTNATITESNGSGSLAATHAYAASGLYTVTVTVADDDGGTDVRTVQILVDTPPTVDAGGPYVGLEGSPMSLTGTATDPDGDNLTYTWDFSSTGPVGTVCTANGGGIHALNLNLTCNDTAVVTATLTASDGISPPVVSAPATLTVGNVSPVVAAVLQSPTTPSGTTATVTSSFTDPGTNDVHTATVDWGDNTTSPAVITESAGIGTLVASHLYAVDDNYNVLVTVTDNNGGAGVSTSTVTSDTTAPVITPHLSPSPNGAGWNSGPVTITWTVADSLSPITATSGCDPTTLSSDTAVSSYTCTATSAGGTASRTTTVKLDQVAPTLAGAPTTASNPNGWYNGPVTIHWTCSDALSGVDGLCPSDDSLTSEGAAVTASASVADVAGNLTSANSAPVNIDTHAPVTAASTTPTWSNDAVVLQLSATDNLSGVASTSYTVDGGATQSGTSVVVTDEGIHTVTFWSTDLAGNVEDANTATVRIDKSAPIITASQAPAANSAGWNKTNVTVTFTCADALSGIASCTSPQTATSEGAGQTTTGHATDNAGNSASATASYSIDKTAPSISGATPSANAAGWYNAPVTVTWACSDELSGVASCPAPTTLSTDGPSQSASATVTDAADNTQTGSVSGINIDQVAPTITAAVSPGANPAGWSSGPVTVQFTCSDATSGLTSSACPGDQQVTAEGISTISGSVTDRAGNTSSTSIVVRIDTIPPAIIGSQTPAANGAGWNNSDVTVSFNCTDAGSGIAVAGCSAPIVLGEGAGQSVTGTGTDTAGNSSTATVSGINVDETPPALTGAPTTAPNANGWYNGPVTIHWTCSDSLSGIAGTCPADSVINSEGTGLSASASVLDAAGNSTSATSAAVKIDQTAPSTSMSTVPDWSNNDVTLTLSATDNLSGVATTSSSVDGGPTHSGTSVVVADEGVHTVAFWSTDVAGNVEAANTATVRIDRTAPVITAAQSPVANGAGWNNTNVTVTFACSDALSGIASCTAPQTATTEGAGQSRSGTAVDNAGNTASANETFNIDTTAPTIVGVSPSANANGWYNAPVTVTWSCGDALSGVAACPAPTTLSADGSGQSVTGTAADAANNTRSASVSGINIDQVEPDITATVSPAPDANGWNTGPVTVHWVCNDDRSGVAFCPADQSVSAEGFTTLAQTITDRAGNASTSDITLRIDKTPPTIVGMASPAPNSNGWNNTNVTVTFTCNDTLSGVAFCSPPSTLGQGAGQSVTGTDLDEAGNSAASTVSGINVDQTPPTLSGMATTAPNAGGWYNHAVTIHWTCGDALSGVDASTCPADAVINGEGTAQQLSRSVLDLAGNSTSASSPPVKIDLTAPLTSATTALSANHANVVVTLAATDNLSGVAQTTYSVDGGANQVGTSVTVSATGTHTVKYFSTDVAGNVEAQHTLTVKATDATKPTITYTISPTPNSAGWNKTNVTVTFTCTDSDSGIASCTPPQSVTTEGAGRHVSGTAVDNAGNTATTQATVSIDKTPPVVTSTLSSSANSFGWYKTQVSATFKCTDALSGIASCSSPATFGEGANQTKTGTAVDVAGNTTTTSVGPLNVDLTKPTITASVSGSPNHSGYYDGPVTVHFTCTDALSGIVPGTGCPTDKVISTNGTTSVSGTATDRAGNTATVTVTVTIKEARCQRQDQLIDIDDYLNHSHGHDRDNLLNIRDYLSQSLDPGGWGDGNHLQHHQGVFSDDHNAVSHIQGLYGDWSGGSTSVLDGWISTITDTDQVIAQQAIDDAISSHGSASAISSAQSYMNQAATSLNAGHWTDAIDAWGNAWQRADNA